MREAQTRCSPAEFVEWKALFQLDPWGEERADLRMGQLVAMLGNALRRKGGRTLKPGDFYLSDRRGVRRQSAKDVESIMFQVMAYQNARHG